MPRPTEPLAHLPLDAVAHDCPANLPADRDTEPLLGALMAPRARCDQEHERRLGHAPPLAAHPSKLTRPTQPGAAPKMPRGAQHGPTSTEWLAPPACGPSPAAGSAPRGPPASSSAHEN